MVSHSNLALHSDVSGCPFTTDNFLATFSKPNLYFHATTTYTVLRQLGTPLGKLDFLGNMKVGH